MRCDHKGPNRVRTRSRLLTKSYCAAQGSNAPPGAGPIHGSPVGVLVMLRREFSIAGFTRSEVHLTSGISPQSSAAASLKLRLHSKLTLRTSNLGNPPIDPNRFSCGLPPRTRSAKMDAALSTNRAEGQPNAACAAARIRSYRRLAHRVDHTSRVTPWLGHHPPRFKSFRAGEARLMDTIENPPCGWSASGAPPLIRLCRGQGDL